jgi:fatty-acyl-CoA synthase
MHRNVGLGSWIARQARTRPGKVALWFREQPITYARLDARITRLARALDALGVRAGDRVAYLGDNHPAAFETLFACGVLGAVYVPLHPGFDASALETC